MKKYNRVFVVVLDSLGIGHLPDAEKFGDVGADTFGNILKTMGKLRSEERRVGKECRL